MKVLVLLLLGLQGCAEGLDNYTCGQETCKYFREILERSAHGKVINVHICDYIINISHR